VVCHWHGAGDYNLKNFEEDMNKKWSAKIRVKTKMGAIWEVVLDRFNNVVGIVSNHLQWSDWRFRERFGAQKLSLLTFCQRHEFELLPT
jgi:hypothetical protein